MFETGLCYAYNVLRKKNKWKRVAMEHQRTSRRIIPDISFGYTASHSLIFILNQQYTIIGDKRIFYQNKYHV